MYCALIEKLAMRNTKTKLVPDLILKARVTFIARPGLTSIARAIRADFK